MVMFQNMLQLFLMVTDDGQNVTSKLQKGDTSEVLTQ